MEEEKESEKCYKNDPQYNNNLLKSLLIKKDNFENINFYGSNNNKKYIIIKFLFMILCFILIFMNFVLFNLQFVFFLISPFIFIVYIHYYYKPEIKNLNNYN